MPLFSAYHNLLFCCALFQVFMCHYNAGRAVGKTPLTVLIIMNQLVKVTTHSVVIHIQMFKLVCNLPFNKMALQLLNS